MRPNDEWYQEQEDKAAEKDTAWHRYCSSLYAGDIAEELISDEDDEDAYCIIEMVVDACANNKTLPKELDEYVQELLYRKFEESLEE